jgi:HlyD family secretion protein
MQATAVQKKKKRRKRLWVVGGVVIVLLVVIGFFLIRQRNNQAGASDAQTGDVVTAFIGDLAASATASGQVEAEQVARLSVNSSGPVQEVLAREGMPVQAGDALVQMDTTDLVLQVAKAEQNLALKEANLESLLEGPIASDVASAEAAAASAQAKLDELLAGPTEQDIAESEASIRQQQAAVASASAGFGSTRDSISASSIASAEAEVVSAQIAYDQAKERNEDFAFSFTHEAMIDAEEDLAIAQAKVNELKSGANQGSLNSASADISAATSNLAQARANHSSLIAGSAAE